MASANEDTARLDYLRVEGFLVPPKGRVHWRPDELTTLDDLRAAIDARRGVPEARHRTAEDDDDCAGADPDSFGGCMNCGKPVRNVEASR